jgi:hypothetical protein
MTTRQLRPAVLDLLRHLEAVGYPAPHVVGAGPEVTYVPGESPHPNAWDLAVVGGVGVLLRRLHDATATFVPTDDLWEDWWIRAVGAGGPVIGHGDAAPWNIVGEGGRPDAFIDWEYAGPIDPLTDLAYAAWLNAQLHDDDVAEQQGLGSARERASALRAILDGYELRRADRTALVERMIEVAVHAARAEAVMAAVGPDSTDAVAPDGYPILWGITWRARSAAWMLRHRSLLNRAVG